MSVAIKRMLAERARGDEQDLSANPKEDAEIAAVMNAIDRAKPFIDEHANPKKWPPSTLLRIGYFVLATGDKPEMGVAFVSRHLAKARKRFLAGLDPNPFIKEGSK